MSVESLVAYESACDRGNDLRSDHSACQLGNDAAEHLGCRKHVSAVLELDVFQAAVVVIGYIVESQACCNAPVLADFVTEVQLSREVVLLAHEMDVRVVTCYYCGSCEGVDQCRDHRYRCFE